MSMQEDLQLTLLTWNGDLHAYSLCMRLTRFLVENTSNTSNKLFFSFSSEVTYTVQTVAADLRQGEHIPKMQNDKGHKSKLRMLRQRGGKEVGGGALAPMPYRAVTSRAVPGHAARRLAWRCVLHNFREFKPDRIRRIRQRQHQKHRTGSNHLPSDL